MKHKKTIKVGIQQRQAEFDRAAIDKESRTAALSFSSEAPVERWFGFEILDHGDGSARLKRLNRGGALLVNHNKDDQVGVVENAEIGADRKGRAVVRFGKSQRADEIFQDVQDGIRTGVSFRYAVHKLMLEKEEKDAPSTYRCTDWEPVEISIESIPADITVGVGREAGVHLVDEAREIEVIIPQKRMEEKTMEKCIKCGADLLNGSCPACARREAELAAVRTETEKSERARIAEIMAIGTRHNLMDMASEYVRDGKSLDAFREAVLSKISNADPTLNVGSGPPATAPDAPIYRGSASTMLGQQLLDIRTMTRPENHRAAEVRASRSRLEQNNRRNEERAAGTGGFNIGTPSEGGFVLQGETAIELMTAGFNNSEVLRRCASRTLAPGTQFVEIVGIDETSRVTGSRGGGVRVYTTAELAALTQSMTKFNKIRIEPKKLTGMYYASGEMVNNATFLGQEMRQLFGEEFAFKCQDLVINGLGAAEAQGILAASCTVSVAKESGQVAKTVLTKNLSKMYSRLMGKNPVWLINRDVTPELDELSIPAGTGALEPRFVTYGPDGIMRIKGAPVVEIEQCATLGTVGDIILADFSQYITANKGDVNEAMSIHVNFIYDQDTYRFIYYFDGQPRFASAITPYKGTNTVSPFVTLATRA